MKFISVAKLIDTDYEIIHINIDHIVTISDHWVEKESLQMGCQYWDNHAKILLSNGFEIICEETVEMIEKEFKELFKQY
jgi:hypothetical protein